MLKPINELNFFNGKRLLFVFSDPAGAKGVISIFLAFINQIKESKLISDRFYPFYAEMGVQVEIISISQVNEILNDFCPDVIVAGTSIPSKIDLEFCIQAKGKALIYSFVDHWTNFKERFLNSNIYYLPDFLLVIDSIAKQKALEAGFNKESILIISNPYYNYLKKWKHTIERSRFLLELDLDENTKYVLYAPEPLSLFNLNEKYGFDEFDSLEFLINTISNFESVILLFKCHPNHVIDDVLNRIKFMNCDIKKIIVLKDDVSMPHLIKYASCVIGYFSNSLIEAKYLGAYVIRLLSKLNNFGLDPLRNKRIGIVVKNNTKLKSIIYNRIK